MMMKIERRPKPTPKNRPGARHQGPLARFITVKTLDNSFTRMLSLKNLAKSVKWTLASSAREVKQGWLCAATPNIVKPGDEK